MTPAHWNLQPPNPDSAPRWRRVLRHPLARMLAAALAIFLALASSFALTEVLLPKDMPVAWPSLVAALACGFGYWIYARGVERREVTELSGSGALAEWTRGAGLGVLLGVLTLAPLWVLVLALCFVLMRGGVFGLTPVETSRWGGFPLTLGLSVVSLAVAFPLAILVALGRSSKLPAIRAVCVLYVELIRGVPLISVLFMASFMFPLFMPQGTTIDVLLRVLVGMTLFAAAYLAEVVRGGLQALPKGQVEAAQALGLTYWQTTRKIVLPQALRLVVPAIVNSFISTFKDTSLVTIVSLYDLTGALQLALGDADWRKFFLEGQLFVAGVYFVCCFALSRYSRWVEAYLNTGMRRQ